MSVAITNLYAKATSGTLMGPQSQRRLSLVQRTHQLAGRSDNKKKQKTGQQTLFGGFAFDSMVDCERCAGVAAGRDPHRAHDPRCVHNRKTKGYVASAATLAQQKIDKDLHEHFTAPLKPEEKGSWRYLAKDNVQRFFEPSTCHKVASQKPRMTTTTKSIANSSRSSPDWSSTVNEKLKDPLFCNEFSNSKAPLAMLAVACCVMERINKVKDDLSFFDGLTFTVAKSDNDNHRYSTPHYHSIAGNKLLLVDWKRMYGIDVKCPTCKSGAVMESDRSNFSKSKILFPIYNLETTLRRGGNFFDVQRIARSCDCNRAKADDVRGACEYTTLSDVEDDQKIVDKTPGHVAEMPVCSSGGVSVASREKLATKKIQEAKDSLKEKGFHPVENAFVARCIHFGLDPQNIFGACPVDLMHAFQSGIVMYLTKMILDRLTPKPKKELDQLVEELLGTHKSSMSAFYPKYTFSKGFSKVSNITSDEWVGKLFVLYMVSLTRDGQEILAKRFNGTVDLPLPADFEKLDSLQLATTMSAMADVVNEQFPTSAVGQSRHQNKKRKGRNTRVLCNDANPPAGGGEEPGDVSSVDSGGKKNLDEAEDVLQKCSYRDFQNLCESLLCFHSWYRIDSGTGFVMPAHQHRSIGPSQRYTIMATAMSKLMALVKYYLPRKAGHRWKIQKFHDMLHIPWDTYRFGSPKNWDAGFLESSLRFWAKFPANSAQNRGYNEFVGQVSHRLYEYLAMAKARRENGVVGVRDKHLGDLDDSGGVAVSRDDMKKHFGGLPVLGGTCFCVSSEGPTRIHPVVDNYLRKHDDTTSEEYHGIPPPGRDGNWKVMSELKTVLADNADGRRVLFRCHIDYRSTGQSWFDWAVVRFEGSPMESSLDTFNKPGCVPCKLLGFMSKDQRNHEHSTSLLSTALDNIMVIVHACEYQSSPDIEASKVLSERHKLEFTNCTTNRTERKARPVLRIVCASSIIAPCFVYEEKPGLFETVDTSEYPNYGIVHQLLDRHKWGSEFM